MTPRRVDDPVAERVKLASEVDRGFEEIRARRTACMECRSGCSDCCRARLSIPRVEEAVLRDGLSQLPDVLREEFRRRAADPKRETCPALDPQGRCQVYAHRPLICRSYGVPLRHRREVPLIHPPVIDVCDKNFVGIPLESLPEHDLMDQTRLDDALREIDDEYCRQRRLPLGERVLLAKVLCE